MSAEPVWLMWILKSVFENEQHPLRNWSRNWISRPSSGMQIETGLLLDGDPEKKDDVMNQGEMTSFRGGQRIVRANRRSKMTTRRVWVEIGFLGRLPVCKSKPGSYWTAIPRKRMTSWTRGRWRHSGVARGSWEPIGIQRGQQAGSDVIASSSCSRPPFSGEQKDVTRNRKRNAINGWRRVKEKERERERDRE